MLKSIKKYAADECGATAIEYALIASATGLAIAAVMPDIKTNLEGKFTSVGAALK